MGFCSPYVCVCEPNTPKQSRTQSQHVFYFLFFFKLNNYYLRLAREMWMTRINHERWKLSEFTENAYQNDTHNHTPLIKPYKKSAISQQKYWIYAFICFNFVFFELTEVNFLVSVVDRSDDTYSAHSVALHNKVIIHASAIDSLKSIQIVRIFSRW